MTASVPSKRVRDLIRRATEAALRQDDTWVREIDEATLSTSVIASIAADPALNDAVRRGNYDNLMAWATANIRAPGEPVPANTSDVQLDVARDLVRRGLFEAALDAYRTGQDAAWKQWMRLCFSLTDDPRELEELLTVTAASITDFVNATIGAIAERMAAERDELTQGSQAERRELVALILQGAPLSSERAEQVLAYRFGGGHVAAVIWAESAGSDLGRLEDAAESFMRSARARQRLTVLAGATTLWVWLPVPAQPSTAGFEEALRELPGIRATIGTVAEGIEGFRRSHQEAVEAQRFVHRCATRRQVVTFEDVEVASLMGKDPTLSTEFTARVLGDLAGASPEIHETVRTYLQSLGNAAVTAERLFTHRNTVFRRLDRANRLLPQPLHEDPLRIAMALEALRWQPGR